MRTIDVVVADVQIGKRLRRLNPEKVTALCESITEIGLRSPISVTDDCLLIAGLHRLEAFKRLGMEKIPGIVFADEALDAELAQIDENLIRAELTVLERGEHLARRKEIYEARHPETKKGGDRGNQHTGGKERQSEEISFSQDAATKTNQSRRTVEQEVQISRALSDEVKEQIRDTPIADSKTDLLVLARMEPEEQKSAATKMIARQDERPHVAQNTGYSEWYTPAEYIQAARKVMGGIDLDPASTKEANTVVKAKHIYTAEQDGLQQEWKGRVWMNPPYASELVSKFSEKLAGAVNSKAVPEAIVLVNNATETGWFSQLIEVASAVCFPRGRVRFWEPNGRTSAPLQGQAVIYIGVHSREFRVEFAEFGWTVRV